jgi:hypothetical protein
MLHVAYQLGARQALEDFQKFAAKSDDEAKKKPKSESKPKAKPKGQNALVTAGDYAAPAASALLSPLAGGIVSGATAPNDRIMHAVGGTGAGIGGGALGALGGAFGGWGAGALANALGADLSDDTRAKMIALPAILGSLGGSGYGTHWYRQRLKEMNPEDNRG